jgi:hypothetical protein
MKPVQGVVGVDRNLRNVAARETLEQCHVCYDVSKAVEIAENTRSTVRSFRAGRRASDQQAARREVR